MVELLLVIVTVGIISIVALPKFLDFRLEAKVATSRNYLNGLKGSLVAKKTQLMLYCNQSADVWPRIQSIQMNDLTEGDAPGSYCTTDQVRDPQARKFFDQGGSLIPENPYTNRSDIVVTSCVDFCTCDDEAGYLYNPTIGKVGHPLLLEECEGRVPAGSSSSVTSGSSSGGSSSTSSSESSECTVSYSLNGDDLCQEACSGDLVERSFCETVGDCSVRGVAYGQDGNGMQCFADASCSIDYGTAEGVIDCARAGGSGQYFSIGWCDWVSRGGAYDAEIQGACGDVVIVPGCMTSGYDNYNLSASVSDDSCACNENRTWSAIDMSCVDVVVCTDPGDACANSGGTWDSNGCTCNCILGSWDGSNCVHGDPLFGCMTPGYDNYDLNATLDDGSCACGSGRYWNGSACEDEVVVEYCNTFGYDNFGSEGACACGFARYWNGSACEDDVVVEYCNTSGYDNYGSEGACACGSGRHWNGSACEDDVETCNTSGYDNYGSEGACACGSGRHWNGSACEDDVETCNTSGYDNYGSEGACACGSGRHWDGSSSCVDDVETCNTSGYDNYGSEGACACGSGRHWDGFSSCINDSVSCDPGYHDNGMGGCDPDT